MLRYVIVVKEFPGAIEASEHVFYLTVAKDRGWWSISCTTRENLQQKASQ